MKAQIIQGKEYEILMKKDGQPIRCFIFDLDGTLVSTQVANFKAYQRAFADVGVRLTKSKYGRHFGLRFAELIEEIAPNLTKSQRQRVLRAKSIYYKKNFEFLKLNLPLVGFLKMLTKDYKVALATTASQKNAQQVLRKFNLLNTFDVTVFGEDVKRSKPAPDCYLLCMARLRVKPKECLVFEDSEVGIIAAMRSGANVLRVPKL